MTNPNTPNKSNWKAVVKEWVESILVALLLAIIIRSYFIEPFKIPSGSMRMTLIEGDFLFVSKLRYGPILLPEIHSPDFIRPIIGDVQWPDALKPLTKIRLPGFSKPKRGDIIVFIYPQDRTKNFIKRLIGLPGDIVEVRDGDVFINGELVTDPRIKNIYYYNRGDFAQPGEKTVVPEHHYFVMGDNSASSHDSRYWGFVEEKDVIGKAELLFWPVQRIRVLK